jgi:hypothetical protein
MTNSTINNWEKTYGARRRAIDRALLTECENALGEPQISQNSHSSAKPPNTVKNSGRLSPLDQDARTAIAKAFGRPLT